MTTKHAATAVALCLLVASSALADETYTTNFSPAACHIPGYSTDGISFSGTHGLHNTITTNEYIKCPLRRFHEIAIPAGYGSWGLHNDFNTLSLRVIDRNPDHGVECRGCGTPVTTSTSSYFSYSCTTVSETSDPYIGVTSISIDVTPLQGSADYPTYISCKLPPYHAQTGGYSGLVGYSFTSTR